MSLQIGDKCPDFSLRNQCNEFINCSDLIGEKILIIFFYPKDETRGCTKEVCSFRDHYENFKDLGCEVLGISSDSVESHKNFSQKHHLSYSLLSDPDKKLRKAFGVPANLFGLIPGRVTYIIDKKGIIRGMYNSLTDPLGHIDKAIEFVKELQ